VYEHSPWVAEQSYPEFVQKPPKVAVDLAALMSRIMRAAKAKEQLALIRAHPDLAGKAALAGELTDESTSEQKGAGLDQCSADEFARFIELNAAYVARFGFPFIIAVKGHDRGSILQAFEDRLQNSHDAEFTEALRQIDQIAKFRIEETYP